MALGSLLVDVAGAWRFLNWKDPFSPPPPPPPWGWAEASSCFFANAKAQLESLNVLLLALSVFTPVIVVLYIQFGGRTIFPIDYVADKKKKDTTTTTTAATCIGREDAINAFLDNVMPLKASSTAIRRHYKQAPKQLRRARSAKN
jgi:hypothetical protein